MPLEKRLTSLGDQRVTSATDDRSVIESGREIEQLLADAMTASVVVPFIAIDLLFNSPGPAVFLWAGIGNFVYNSNTYVGQGTLLQITRLEETRQLKAAGTRVSLSGISTLVKELVLNEKYSGRTLRVHAGAINNSTGLLIGAEQLFQGQMDQMTYEQTEGDESRPEGPITVSLSAEHEWSRFELANDPNYTAESHKSRFPDDTFFDFVVQLQDQSIVWNA